MLRKRKKKKLPINLHDISTFNVHRRGNRRGNKKIRSVKTLYPLIQLDFNASYIDAWWSIGGSNS